MQSSFSISQRLQHKSFCDELADSRRRADCDVHRVGDFGNDDDNDNNSRLVYVDDGSQTKVEALPTESYSIRALRGQSCCRAVTCRPPAHRREAVRSARVHRYRRCLVTSHIR